jgi:hypothetical protein
MKTRTIKNPTELGGMLGENVAVKKKGKKVVLTNRPTSKIIPLASSIISGHPHHYTSSFLPCQAHCI